MANETCIECKNEKGGAEKCCSGSYFGGANWKCGSKTTNIAPPSIAGFTDKNLYTADEVCAELGAVVLGKKGWTSSTGTNPFALSSAKRKK